MSVIEFNPVKSVMITGSLSALKTSMFALKTSNEFLFSSALQFDECICNLGAAKSGIRGIVTVCENEISSVDALIEDTDIFFALVSDTDIRVGEEINNRKDDFYAAYNYLKPDCEKNGWELFCDWCDGVADWCAKHWKEIVITIVIVVGAVLAIAAVIASGGMALVPLLSSALMALGVSSGTAMTVATVTSLVVAGIAIASTLGSSVLNIIDTWVNIDNPTFNAFQKGLNIASMISNGLYSIGSVFNGIKGIENSNLRYYARRWTTDSEFRSIIRGASNYNFNLPHDLSTFWSGLGKDGQYIAENCADKMGRITMENALDATGTVMPKWDEAIPSTIRAWKSSSSSFAMRSSGDVVALLGDTLKSEGVWNAFEKPLLLINPNVGNIIMFTPSAGAEVITRSPQIVSIITNLLSDTYQTGAAANDWN